MNLQLNNIEILNSLILKISTGIDFNFGCEDESQIKN